MKHLGNDFLVRGVDDELFAGERIELEEHLVGCEECRRRYRELGALTVHLEHAVGRTPVAVAMDARGRIESEIVRRTVAKNSKRRGSMFRWAAAAVLVGGAILIPTAIHHVPAVGPATVGGGQPPSFELDGETFIGLPYSNPELPISSSRIVQMEIPVSSLTDAGIVVTPVSDEPHEGSVLADVLLGADGEPRAVHVVSEL
jgi:hypothetical protein